jgi:hypothetical protein
VRAEATKHVLPGCKSLGRPVAVCTAVGTTWGASKLGGLNIKEYLQPRKAAPWKVVFAGKKQEADLLCFWGRPMHEGRNRQMHFVKPAVAWDQAPEERFAEITSGRSC